MKSFRLLPLWSALSIISASVFMSGCATPRLADVRSVQNDDAAYLVFGAQGQVEKQREVGRRMVERAYDRVNALRPPPEQRTIDVWDDYLAELEKPISIDAQSYRTAPELKQIGDLQLVADYIKKNPEALKLQGDAWLAAWADDLAHARAQVADIRGIIETASQEAQALAEQKLWTEAYAAIGKAVSLAPRDAKIRRLAQHIQDNLAAGVTGDLDRAVKQITTLQKQFGTKQSTLKRVAEAESLLSPALDQAMAIQRLLAEVTIPFTDKGVPAKLEALRKSALEVSGATWAELIRLQAAEKKYWAAYASTLQFLARIAEVPELAKTDASNQVVQAFADQVVDAVRHLLEQSNDAFYSDRFGAAFLASRMSREIYDYAGTIAVEARESAAAPVQQADQTAEDAINRIRTQFDRRLLVTDFVPAVTEDYENLGFQIRTRCRYLSLPGNGLAWALEVPAPKSLMLETIGNRSPYDLVLSGVMDKKVQVDVLNPVELERGYTEVGTTRSRQVPNPLYGMRDGELRTVFQQETHLYPWIKTLHRKQARIALHVVREQPGVAAQPVYLLDETYPNDAMTFEGLAIESENLTYQPLILGSPRIANGRNDFSVDAPPTGKAPALAPDDEVARAVINHVIEGVMAAIEQEVAQFPVESIAAKAVEYQNKNQSDLAADAWGQFLVYIDKLAPVADKAGTSWLKRRDELQAFIQGWSQSRWSGQAEELRAAVDQAWILALAAYNAAE